MFHIECRIIRIALEMNNLKEYKFGQIGESSFKCKTGNSLSIIKSFHCVQCRTKISLCYTSICFNFYHSYGYFDKMYD